MSYMEKYRLWCTDEYFDAQTRQELLSIKDNEKEIEDRFYKELEFGTGGLRGLLGAGCNRMNIYTVRKATQGIADYINKTYADNKSVAIAYDSRKMSQEFAKETALCFAANGIKAYLFEKLTPTPELSFAVRQLNCTAGVVITASHNPSQYNGYKVYLGSGCQVTPPFDKQLIDCVNAVESYKAIKTVDEALAKANGLLCELNEEIDREFIERVKKMKFTDEDLTQVKKDLRIVYTPLHGTGNIPVTRILKESGYENVFVVEEQKEPDGNFSTVESPNPEERSAFEYALRLAKKKDADIVLATDPDADRLGVYVKNENSEYVSFNGNMVACLMAQFILSQKSKAQSMPKNPVIVKTIVTTNMLCAIARRYSVDVVQVLTGFKYIGEKINEFEENSSKSYIFGAEESYGYLADTFVRDKDAVSSTKLLCDMCAYYKKQGKTLCDVLNQMYKTYGYFKEDLSYIVMEGVQGANKIRTIMEKVRNEKPTTLGNEKVVSIKDYLTQKELNLSTGTQKEISLNKSDVLYFKLEDDSFFCLRPSGTEPKIKMYTSIKAQSEEEAQKRIEDIKKDLEKFF